MTIFGTWQSIVTLDSIRNSCDVLRVEMSNHILFRIVIELFKVVIENWDWISSKDCDWIVMNILTKITFISFITFITFISFITFIKFLELGLEVADKDGLVWNPESEKPMWHGGIATWKVFARPESFCAYLWNPPLKDMPKFTDFQMVWKVSGWSAKFPDGLESFQMVWKLSWWSGKFPDGLESFRMVWKVSG